MPNLSRRNVMVGAAGALGAVALMRRPGDRSGPRDPYFVALQNALVAAKIATPTLVIDRARLNANIDTLKSHLPRGMGYRIVAKSLPSGRLIQHISARAGTDRLMTFNQPMLNTLSTLMPSASQLLGKPLPVAAARAYFDALPPAQFTAADNIQWLIDTPERLRQYADLSNAVGRPFKLNLELDVGLHRGGFEPGPALKEVLDTIHASDNLTLAGFMGYEPHLPAVPEVLGWRARAKNHAWALVSRLFEDLPPIPFLGQTRRTGSPATRRAAPPTAIMKIPASPMRFRRGRAW